MSSLSSFFLQVFLCHPALTSFILLSDFSAFRTMEKSMPFLNQLLFLTQPFHSYGSSQVCKNIFITILSLNTICFSYSRPLYYSKAQRCEKKKAAHLPFPLVNSLHSTVSFFCSCWGLATTCSFLLVNFFFNHEFKKIANFSRRKI